MQTSVQLISTQYHYLSGAKNLDELIFRWVKILNETLGERKFDLIKLIPGTDQFRFRKFSPSENMEISIYPHQKEIIEFIHQESLETKILNQIILIPQISENQCVGLVVVYEKISQDVQVQIELLAYWAQNLEEKLNLIQYNEQLVLEITQNLHHISVLSTIAQTVSKAQDLNHLLSMILREALTTVSAARGFIMLLNEHSGELELKVAHGLTNPRAVELINSGLLKTAGLLEGEGIQGHVMQTREPMIVSRSKWDTEVLGAQTDGSKSVMCVPLMMKNKPFGVLYVANAQNDRDFVQTDLDLLTILSANVSTVVDQVRLYNLANTDELTGLYTRRYYAVKLGEEIKRAVRYKRPISLMVLDIDHFKMVNDQYGHHVGDHVLRKVAAILYNLIRQNLDTAVRLGGEEFVVIFPETQLIGAKAVAERIRQTIMMQEMEWNNHKFKITVSIGLSCFPNNESNAEELFPFADKALYLAKSSGRNKVCCFPEN